MRLASSKTAVIASTLLATLAVVASCRVDMEGLVFEDETHGTGGMGGSNPSEECEHGTLGCDGRQVRVCAAGDWYPAGAPCEFTCVAGLCVGSCVPNSTQCVTSTAQQTCNEVGMWGGADECEFACIDGSCSGECTPGVMGCSSAMPQRCDDAGQWQDQRETPCPDSCEAGVCTGGCSDEDETQCASVTEVLRCDGQSWGTPEQCEFACVGGNCGGVCKPAATDCASPVERRTCSPNGEWVSSSCGDQACVDGQCVGECKPGATRCRAGGVEECNLSGQWAQATPCDTDTPVCAVVEGKAQCVVCQPKLKRCQMRRVSTCSDDGSQWIAGETCRDVCYAGACYAEDEVCEIRDAKGCSSATQFWHCTNSKYDTGTCPPLEECVDGSCAGTVGPVPLSGRSIDVSQSR